MFGHFVHVQVNLQSTDYYSTITINPVFFHKGALSGILTPGPSLASETSALPSVITANLLKQLKPLVEVNQRWSENAFNIDLSFFLYAMWVIKSTNQGIISAFLSFFLAKDTS